MPEGRFQGPGGQGPLDLSQILGRPMSEEEALKRQKIEYDLVLMGQVNAGLVRTGDIMMSMEKNEVFQNFPKREEILQEATDMHAVYLEYQMTMLRRVAKAMKLLEPLGAKPPIQIRGN